MPVNILGFSLSPSLSLSPIAYLRKFQGEILFPMTLLPHCPLHYLLTSHLPPFLSCISQSLVNEGNNVTPLAPGLSTEL